MKLSKKKQERIMWGIMALAVLIHLAAAIKILFWM